MLLLASTDVTSIVKAVSTSSLDAVSNSSGQDGCKFKLQSLAFFLNPDSPKARNITLTMKEVLYPETADTTGDLLGINSVHFLGI